MRMKALKGFRQGSTGVVVSPGDLFEEPNAGRADHYERNGMAYGVNTGPPPTLAREATVQSAPPAPNEAATAGPLASAGGETGVETPPSSSPAAPAPGTPRSRSRRAGQGSSPSTKAGD